MGAFGNLTGGDYTDIRRRDVEAKCIGTSECKTRKATPEELEHYFGKTAQKGGGGGRQYQAERLVKAAEKVSRHQYETMKAAVAIVGMVHGWK